MSEAAAPSYWSRARVEAEVARGFPRFMAEARLPPSPSFDRTAPREPLIALAPEPRPAPVVAVRPAPPKPRPAPRAAPIQETLL